MNSRSTWCDRVALFGRHTSNTHNTDYDLNLLKFNKMSDEDRDVDIESDVGGVYLHSMVDFTHPKQQATKDWEGFFPCRKMTTYLAELQPREAQPTL